MGHESSSAVVSQPFGKYVLLRRLAVGGMAEVFLAKSFGAGGFEKEVVIKRILPQFGDDAEFVEMFKEEAKLVARLHHANIVQVFEFDRTDGAYYLAMEYIDGRDLRRVIEQARRVGRRFPVAIALEIAHAVARGLGYAHSRRVDGVPLGIVHRDVSPHNILVSFHGEVKVSDFGIAKAASRTSVTRTGVVKGKIAYMSPEQAAGEAVDNRSDLFALGIVLYEMLYGERPFRGESDVEVLAKVLRADVPRPAVEKTGAGVDADADDLWAAVSRLLARRPADRYSSAEEVARELGRLIRLVAANGEQPSLADWMAFLHGESADSKREPTLVLTPAEATSMPDPTVVAADWSATTRTAAPEPTVAATNAATLLDADRAPAGAGQAAITHTRTLSGESVPRRRARQGIVLGVLASVVVGTGVLLIARPWEEVPRFASAPQPTTEDGVARAQAAARVQGAALAASPGGASDARPHSPSHTATEDPVARASKATAASEISSSAAPLSRVRRMPSGAVATPRVRSRRGSMVTRAVASAATAIPEKQLEPRASRVGSHAPGVDSSDAVPRPRPTLSPDDLRIEFGTLVVAAPEGVTILLDGRVLDLPLPVNRFPKLRAGKHNLVIRRGPDVPTETRDIVIEPNRDAKVVVRPL